MKLWLVSLWLAVVVPLAGAQDNTSFAPFGPDPAGNEIFVADGEFRSTPEKAWQVALESARDGLALWLANRPTPIRTPPSLAEMIRLGIVPDVREPRRSDRETFGSEALVRYSVQVTVSPDHLRQFRSRERLTTATWAILGVASLLMLIAAFFRLDEMTRGYLTAILSVGGVLLAATICYILWSR